MIYLALILIILTASGGIFLISYLLTNKNTPKGVVMLHGILGAISLITLIITAIYYPLIWIVVAIFALTAIGGFYTVYTDIVLGTLPKKLASIHGSVAVIGLISLLIIGFYYY